MIRLRRLGADNAPPFPAATNLLGSGSSFMVDENRLVTDKEIIDRFHGLSEKLDNGAFLSDLEVEEESSGEAL